MKALILAGGRGKRLGDISSKQNKCMLEVKGKPLLEYSLNCAVLTDIDEIIIVVGYRAEEIMDNFGISFKGRPIRYVLQERPRGLVHAIECAGTALANEDFMLMLGDELLIKPHHQEMIDTFRNEGLFGLCGTVVVQDISLIKKTYAIISSKDGVVEKLIEKPAQPVNNIMGTGNCIFKNAILDYIAHTPINPNRGERELPDLIQLAVNGGKIIKTYNLCDHYINVNSATEVGQIDSYFAHL